MKNIILSALLLMLTMTISAVPAKQGVKKQFAMNDGTLVTATLCGDEFEHWWQTEEGKRLVVTESGTAMIASPYEVALQTAKSRARRSAANVVRRSKRQSSSVAPGGKPAGTYDGSKKGLVILVNFSNLSMNSSHTQETFDNQFNEVGYNKNYHIGSVHDYFYDQSYGKFDLTFDVVGPVQVSQKYSYYGANDSNGDDKHPAEMVIEACKKVDSLGVDFSDYDWDGDGEVDQVYIIYAGHGEAAGGGSNTIWPHEYDLYSANYYGDGDGPQTFDGVMVNTYACSCELSGGSGNTLNAIGTACHEFSHCLGYMDLYDISYSGSWGMKGWDLMASGSYSGPHGNGEIPTGFSAYERWVAGWLEPTVITKDMEVTDLKPLNDNAEAYVLYNDNHMDELYVLENRLNTRWFSYWESIKAQRQGMLISHLDYDKTVWDCDVPNTVCDESDGYGCSNDHERLTIFRANNNKGTNQTAYSGHLYPYNSKDSLTTTSTPKAIIYNANSAGTLLMPVAIRAITLNSDSTMSFKTSEEIATGIDLELKAENLGLSTENGDTYNLSGQKVGRNASGIVIRNGKKSLISNH